MAPLYTLYTIILIFLGFAFIIGMGIFNYGDGLLKIRNNFYKGGIWMIISAVLIIITWKTLKPKGDLQQSLMRNYKGKVIGKFIDKKNHMYPTLLLKYREEKFQNGFNDNNNLYKTAKIGDSIIKNSNDLSIYLIRNGHVIDSTNYYDIYFR